MKANFSLTTQAKLKYLDLNLQYESSTFILKREIKLFSFSICRSVVLQAITRSLVYLNCFEEKLLSRCRSTHLFTSPMSYYSV